MEPRTSRKNRFQIERLERRDSPSHLIGSPQLIGLLTPVESMTSHRAGYEVRGVAHLVGRQKILPIILTSTAPGPSHGIVAI
jgi:hypothetical protein